LPMLQLPCILRLKANGNMCLCGGLAWFNSVKPWLTGHKLVWKRSSSVVLRVNVQPQDYVMVTSHGNQFST
jgi:hypothetical protein